LANILVTTWGLLLLGQHVGSAFWSAGFFYFAWCLIPCVVVHFGVRKFSATGSARTTLLSAAAMLLLVSGLIVWRLVIVGPITAFSMLVYLPFPLTESLFVAVLVWFARKQSLKANPDF